LKSTLKTDSGQSKRPVRARSVAASPHVEMGTPTSPATVMSAVADASPYGGAAGGLHTVGDDHRYRVADMTHLAARQQRMRRFLHRIAVFARDAPSARHKRSAR
jgi:hypothetical protein